MRSSYSFLNTLIHENSLFIKWVTRDFIMLNAMMNNENKTFTKVFFFSETMVTEYGVCDHDLRKEIKILVKLFLLSIIVFNTMNLLAILEVKVGKTMIKESYRDIT